MVEPIINLIVILLSQNWFQAIATACHSSYIVSSKKEEFCTLRITTQLKFLYRLTLWLKVYPTRIFLLGFNVLMCPSYKREISKAVLFKRRGK